MLQVRLSTIMPLVFAIVLFYGACNTRAQNMRDERKRTMKLRSLQIKVDRMMPMLRQNPTKVIAEIKQLLKENPEEGGLLWGKLGYAYTYAGEPDSAIAAYEKCVAYDPMDLAAAGELARLYINNGEKTRAEALFDSMIARAHNKLRGYSAVAEAEIAAGWYMQALETYSRARKDLKQPNALALEIGDLQKMIGDEKASVLSYLTYARDQRSNLNSAEKKIIQLLENPETDRDAVRKILESESQSQDIAYRGRVLQILASVYIEEGLMEKAMQSALAADRLSSSDGKMLFDLVGRLDIEYEKSTFWDKPRLLDLCLRAIEAYLQRHPRTLDTPKVHLLEADLLLEASSNQIPGRSGQELEENLVSVVKGLDDVIHDFPATSYAEQATLKKGDILFYRLGEREEGLNIYKQGEKQAREHPEQFAERIAKAYLSLGRFSEGKQYCGNMIKSGNKAVSEAGMYYMSMLLAFSGEHEAARDTLTALAESNPASPYTNDAIDAAWVIEAGLKLSPEILEKYIATLAAEMAGDSMKTRVLLERFVELPAATPLRARALYRLGVLYFKTGKYEEALTCFDGVLRDYPESELAPEAERRMGAVYEFGLGEKETALRKYEHILMVYPGYVFLDEVRRDVARLRTPKKSE